MKTCIIFCAGGFTQLAEPIREDDFLMAADGGYAHLEKTLSALGAKIERITM